MPDGPFKGMAPDPDSEPRGRKALVTALGGPVGVPAIECEKCGGMVYEGDWPAGWCKGNPEDHER